MKNLRRIMIMLFALLGLVNVNLLNVNAAPSSVKVKSKSSLYYFTENKGTDYISGYNFYRKELSDGTLVYCVSNINTSVPAGLNLSLKGEITDLGLDYIIQNGYPNKSFTGNELKDYYITQAAIWEYFDETRGSNNWGRTSFKSSDTGMKGYVYSLVSAAKSAKVKEVASPSIDVSANENMSLSGNYYVSVPVKVTLDGTENKYSVKLENAPEGTIIKSTTGEEKTSFKGDEQFIVYVPSSVTASGSVKLSVSSKSTVTKTYEYTSGKSGYQNIGLIVPETTEVSDNLTLKYNKIVTKLSISKQDATSQKELPGATLVIKDSKGEVVDKWVSTDKPHYVEGLKPGDYTLTETIAPDGYVLSTSTIEFKLEADGKVKSVVMYNELKTKLSISKQDITTKEELPGATLVVKDKSGKVIDTWVSTDKPHYIEGLKPGDYTLTETIAPKGYVLSTSTIEFKLEADGKVKSVVMFNSKEEITKVKISKQDITTKEELPGATLEIKDINGNVVDTWVSSTEPHYIEGLEPGEYTLTETIAPDGYKLSTETIKFTLNRDGKVNTVVMYNEKYSVPITDLNVSQITIIGAAVLMLLGTGLVFYAKRSY